jgi:hypothetical protein
MDDSDFRLEFRIMRVPQDSGDLLVLGECHMHDDEIFDAMPLPGFEGMEKEDIVELLVSAIYDIENNDIVDLERRDTDLEELMGLDNINGRLH